MAQQNKAKSIIKIIVAALAAALILLYVNGFFDSEEIKAEKFKQEQIAKIKETKFYKLPIITLDEAKEKIDNGEDFVAYYAWVMNCGDSRLFETNSFDKYLIDEKVNKMIYVIDLDKEVPDALAKPELREPVTKRMLIDTWAKDKTVNPMSLKSPQLVHYKDKKIVDLTSWTVINSDSKYGMKPEQTKAFFEKLKENYDN